jgi:acetyl esterase/lipase
MWNRSPTRSGPSAWCAPARASGAWTPRTSASWASPPAASWPPTPKRVGIAASPIPPTPFERQSSRPDFAVLAYPGGKAANLTVTGETPATFIVVNNDDPLAPASAAYYAALRNAGVPAELHIYNRGGHGFGMTGRTPAFAQLPVSGWPARFQEWMADMGFLAR